MEGNDLHHFHDGWYRSFAPGFRVLHRTTGVMTLATSDFVEEAGFRHAEPLLRTAKAASLTRFPLAGMDETLLVINLHAVNFGWGCCPIASSCMT